MNTCPHPRSAAALLALTLLTLLTLLAADAHAQETATTPRGPLTIALTTGFGAPTGIYGGSVSFEFATDLAAYTGFGLGSTGWQLPLMLRWYTPLLDRGAAPDDATHAISLALGPSLSLLSSTLNTNVPHRDDLTIDESDLWYILWANLEAAYELRGSWGGFFRVALGAALNAANNMAPLCEGVEQGDGAPQSDCNPPHFAPGPVVARVIALPYLNLEFGWEFGR